MFKYNLDKKKTTNISGKKLYLQSKDSKLMTDLTRLFTEYWNIEIPHALTDMQIFWPLCRLGSYKPPIYM